MKGLKTLPLNIGEMASIAAFVAAKKDDQLIVFGTLDRKDGSMDNLTAMVKSLSFDVEVDQAALMARGFGKDGKFVRTDPPAFTLEYPKEFQKQVLQGNQIFRAGIPQGSPSMAIAILSLTAGADIQKQLKAMAEGYANALKSLGSDIKIISQNPVEEYKGFDAYQIQIVWRYRGQITLTTIVDLIAKRMSPSGWIFETVTSISGTAPTCLCGAQTPGNVRKGFGNMWLENRDTVTGSRPVAKREVKPRNGRPSSQSDPRVRI